MVPHRNIYDQERHNRRLTAALLVGFVVLLGVVGLGVDVFYFHMPTPWRPRARGPAFPVATFLAVAIAGASGWWSYRCGDQAILASTHARPAGTTDLAERQLRNVVAEMALAAGLPIPQVYVVPDPDPNAFATGRDPAHASIAVTEGLLRILNREELQGVVSHEMSHIKNYDIRLMMVTAALVGAIALLSDWAARARWYGGRDRDDDRERSGAVEAALFVVWLLAIILAPLVSQMLAMAVSRRREYLADATGAELTRNPVALASALKKIDSVTEPDQVIGRGIAHLCIADPLSRKLTDHEGFWGDVFATHPPIRSRIFALQQMAYLAAGRPAAPPPAGAGAAPRTPPPVPPSTSQPPAAKP